MLKESETIELKASLGEWKEAVIALAAFANRRGGRVIIGVDDRGEPMGLSIGKGALEDLVNKIKQHTDPVLYPSVNVKTFGPGEIIEMAIAENDNKPVFAFEKAYVRVGRVNQKLSVSAVRELIKRYTLPDFDRRWMDHVIGGMIFESALIRAVDRAHYHFKARSDVEFLRRLKVLARGKITNAGYLCFAAKNTLMPNAIVKAARFKGVTMSSFLDMKDFDVPLISAVDDILDFIKRHINMEVIIADKAKRNEAWDYPIDALREAMTNALVHRDYTDPGNIQIRIFDDRLEIWSPGLLPKEISIHHLLKENRSIPRNKALAEIFHNVGQMEGWGSGFQKIFDFSIKNGNGEPSFTERAGAFVVAFRPRGNGGINGGRSGGINGGRSGGINGGRNRALDFIMENEGLRAHQIAGALGMPPDTVEKQLRVLKKAGKIVYRGSKKTGGYYAVGQEVERAKDVS